MLKADFLDLISHVKDFITYVSSFFLIVIFYELRL